MARRDFGNSSESSPRVSAKSRESAFRLDETRDFEEATRGSERLRKFFGESSESLREVSRVSVSHARDARFSRCDAGLGFRVNCLRLLV